MSDAHRSWFPSYANRRNGRIAFLNDVRADVALQSFVEAERVAHPDLDDDIGEPFDLANR